jgi:hypothetical protein
MAGKREIQRAAEPEFHQYNDRIRERHLRNWKSYPRLALQPDGRLDGLLDGDPGHT